GPQHLAAEGGVRPRVPAAAPARGPRPPGPGGVPTPCPPGRAAMSAAAHPDLLAMLEAVKDHPDDDARRLAVADWIPPANGGSHAPFPGVSVYTEDRTRKWVRVSNQSNVRSSNSCIVWQRWVRVPPWCSSHHTRSMGFVSGEYFGR